MARIGNAQWPFGRLTVIAAALGVMAATTPVFADFNGDGYADIAVGVIYQEINSQLRAGMVMEVEGSASGVTTTDTLWHQDSGLVDICETNDYFGWALAIGDFNDDGYFDLAVGVPYEDIDTYVQAGAVQVIYGSSNGLTTSGDMFLNQDNSTTGSSSEPDDYFGVSLAAADFNGDGFEDLAIGSAYEDLGSAADCGAVVVVFGSATGLDPSLSQWITQYYFGGTSETSDRFGYALAAGDFNGDGFADLAASAPGQNVGSVTAAGIVAVIMGSASGMVVGTNDNVWHQDRSGINGACEEDDRFGTDLATGDFDGDGYDDLIVGVRLEDVESTSTYVDAGAIHAIYGSAGGLTATGTQMFYQDNFGTNQSEDGDNFGSSLASGDFNRDGYDDLAVGTPWEDWATVVDTGMIQVIPGSAGGLDGSQGLSIAQNHLLNGASNGTEDTFGFSLATADIDNDGYDDLAIGTPGENLGATKTGSVYVLFGSTSGVSMDNTYFDQCTTGYGGGCDDNDRFGHAVAMRSHDSSSTSDPIFSDGFESGTTSAWDLVVP